ncbi:MAG: hypothetical protein ABIA02_04290 [Candidatus Falkowbacteria bacterium]
MTKILFVCKNNQFRSKVSEAFFKKLNKNKKHKVKSAGIIDNRGRYYNKNVAKKYGVKCKGEPTPLSYGALRWADLVIITASNIPKRTLRIDDKGKYNYKLKKWNAKDVYDGDKKKVEKTLDFLWGKVNKLAGELG